MTGELVLVTGANGFVGAHIFRELLVKGYRVRGTVRSQKKADLIIKKYPQWKDQIEEFILVDDITKPHCFDKAVQGVDYICHVASPFHFDIKDNRKDMLDPALDGTISILEAATTQNSVKRVIITSSFAAVLDLTKGARPGYTYTEKDWNPVTWEEACRSSDKSVVYCASKKFAEEASWKFIRDKRPSFDIATMCMPMIFGPLEHHVENIENLNTSTAQIWSVINSSEGQIPPTEFPAWVDVRDVAAAHVAALTTKSASNARYLVASGAFTNEQIAAIAHNKYPKKPIPHGNMDPPNCFKIDGSRAEKELLGKQYITLADTILDVVEQLYEIESRS